MVPPQGRLQEAGGVTLTVTNLIPVEVPAVFQHSILYVVATIGETKDDELIFDFHPSQVPSLLHPQQEDALVVVQFRVELLPKLIGFGEAENVRVGPQACTEQP